MPFGVLLAFFWRSFFLNPFREPLGSLLVASGSLWRPILAQFGLHFPSFFRWYFCMLFRGAFCGPPGAPAERKPLFFLGKTTIFRNCTFPLFDDILAQNGSLLAAILETFSHQKGTQKQNEKKTGRRASKATFS